MSGYDFVDVRNFNLPRNAVKCGKDLDGSDIFVGLSHMGGDDIPCKIIPRRKEAYVSYNGEEFKVTSFTVLVEKTMTWVSASKGQVPPGAIPAGRTDSGETLFIGRGKINNSTVVGKVHQSHGCLYVPFDGKEVSQQHYEVLAFQ